MNIRNIDLRLLVVFDMVMVERNVTAAARRLGMSQPAVSSAINRLRHVVKDRLFLRSTGGVLPTQKALELAVPVRNVLDQLEEVFEPSRFSPDTATRSFSIALSHNAASAVLPDLCRRVLSEAPGIQLRFRPKLNTAIVHQLDTGETDFVIGILPRLPKRISVLPLFEEEYVCVMRKDHPLAQRHRLTLADFARAEHLAVTYTGETTGHIDRMLDKQRLVRRVPVSINQLLLAPEVLGGSNLILTAFRSMIERQPAFRAFHTVAFPLRISPARIDLAWHAATGERPAHSWLRALIIKAAGSSKRPVDQRGVRL
jgi:DNA-binding transcriptional LysR family regulator